MPRRAGTTIKTTEVKKEDSGVNISDVLSFSFILLLFIVYFSQSELL